ncbi:MAG: glycosyltransferase family 4 protein [Opitutaceae bacterium]|nr:glycosyltransferase family 4 protein [Opitutaceae bacterium]
MPRPIFLNRFYHPDEPATAQLLTDLAETLARRGFEPLVITGQPRDGRIPRDETRHGVTIRRVRGSRWRETRLASKAVNFATFYAAALWRLLFTVRRGDVVTAMTDPPLLGIGVWLVARIRGARVIHWVQDIYPEIAISLGAPTALGALRPLRNAAWRHADACVTLGADMASVLQAAGVSAPHLHVVRNPAPAGVTRQPWPSRSARRAEWHLADKFVVQYSGNLGRVHALEPVLDVAAALQADREIAFLVVGDGAQRAMLMRQVQQRGLPNVQFQPAQPRTALNESLAIGDVHLVTLHSGCARYVFPSKLQGILAVGRPVIYIGPCDGELARLIREHRLGFAFEPAESAGIADTIRRLARDPAESAALSERAADFAAATPDATAEWAALLGQTGIAPARVPSLADTGPA